MDIIKSILHVFKKSDNAFKVMHPETESACITDWNTGIVNTLASTGLSSLVNVLSSDSLLALLIKKVFDAMGVKYSLGPNGYVCWGALFGRVIIQWVLFYGPNKNTALPVAVSKKFAEFATHCGTATSINAIPDFANSFHSLTKIGFNSSDGDDESIFLMISLGQV